jgi:integrase
MTIVALAVAKSSSGPSAAQISTVIDGMDLSDNSRVQYQRDIRVFGTWLDGRALYPNVLFDYKKHLRGSRNDLSTGTKAKYLAVARSLLRELYRLQVLPVDVTANVKGLKVTRQHKRTPITGDEISRVFDFLDSIDADPRARVIIALMYFQGLRRVEVCRLFVDHFDHQAKTLSVLGKGKDDHEAIDLHPRMVAILSGYLTTMGIKSGPLFPSRENLGQGLTSNMIWRIAYGVHRRLGLDGRNLHSYRKAFTTRLIQTGMPLLDVMTYTRHASLEMLSIYYQRLEKAKTLPAYYEAFSV